MPIAHSHDAYEETIYGLEGNADLDGRREAGRRRPGRGALHPSRSSPPLRQRHDVDAKMLAIVTPGVLGPDYFREMAAIVKAAAGGPPDPAALAARDAAPRPHAGAVTR